MTQKNKAPASHKLSKPVLIHTAKTVAGRGRGKGLGIPTINIDLNAIPLDLPYGIYACKIKLDTKTYMGAMHYGPRPVFKDTSSFEVHIIDEVLSSVPETADIEIVGYIRAVMDFTSPKALVERIQQDITIARGMLSV